jgi:hypothetical protein
LGRGEAYKAGVATRRRLERVSAVQAQQRKNIAIDTNTVDSIV